MAKTQGSVRKSDAIETLLEDHKRAQKLVRDFEQADRGDTDTLCELVESACVELQIHALLEEELFYPAIRARLADTDQDHQDLLNEAEVEHEAANELITKLQELEPDDPMYCAYFSVLAEYVKHHMREEEKALFPLARTLRSLDLAQLGDDMRARREELFAEIESDETDESESALEELDEVAEDEDGADEQAQIDISRTRH